jgi:hypothetical protein
MIPPYLIRISHKRAIFTSESNQLCWYPATFRQLHLKILQMWHCVLIQWIRNRCNLLFSQSISGSDVLWWLTICKGGNFTLNRFASWMFRRLWVADGSLTDSHFPSFRRVNDHEPAESLIIDFQTLFFLRPSPGGPGHCPLEKWKWRPRFETGLINQQ